MKKYMLMLAIALIASPALADVKVEIVDADGTGPGLVGEVRYTVTGEPNKVAAFALDITVDAGTITDIGDFHTGVSVAGDAGYGIFPANFYRYITVNGNGDVDDWTPAEYNPAAEAGDKGAQGGIGTAGITVELGALYKGGPNAPADTGVLCTITVSGNCIATPALNGIRGGIVLEGAGDPTGETMVPGPIGGDECFASDHLDYDQWIEMEKPECWCIKTQCLGDADGLKEGSQKKGIFRVHFGDMTILLNAWGIKEDPGVSTLVGDPGICADFSRSQEGSQKKGIFRVHFQDMTILLGNWAAKEGTPTALPVDDRCGGNVDPEP